LALIFNVVYNILLNIPDRLADVQATKNGKWGKLPFEPRRLLKM
jgi:hypothetical protein